MSVVDVADAPSSNIRLPSPTPTGCRPRPMGAVLSPDGKALFVSNGRGQARSR